MTDEEALKKLDELKHRIERHPNRDCDKEGEAWTNAYYALREKVAAKKPRRPTLEEMEEEVRCSVNTDLTNTANYRLVAAADIIKAVRERVVPWLKASVAGCPPDGTWLRLLGIQDDSCSRVYSIDLLRALGEEP